MTSLGPESGSNAPGGQHACAAPAGRRAAGARPCSVAGAGGEGPRPAPSGTTARIAKSGAKTRRTRAARSVLETRSFGHRQGEQEHQAEALPDQAVDVVLPLDHRLASAARSGSRAPSDVVEARRVASGRSLSSHCQTPVRAAGDVARLEDVLPPRRRRRRGRPRRRSCPLPRSAERASRRCASAPRGCRPRRTGGRSSGSTSRAGAVVRRRRCSAHASRRRAARSARCRCARGRRRRSRGGRSTSTLRAQADVVHRLAGEEVPDAVAVERRARSSRSRRSR